MKHRGIDSQCQVQMYFVVHTYFPLCPNMSEGTNLTKPSENKHDSREKEFNCDQSFAWSSFVCINLFGWLVS